MELGLDSCCDAASLGMGIHREHAIYKKWIDRKGGEENRRGATDGMRRRG
jgi:hypothetical protein